MISELCGMLLDLGFQLKTPLSSCTAALVLVMALAHGP